MMHETMDYLFSESNDYKAIELPYKGKRISMIVILPEIEINDFCQQLNYTKTESILNELKTERVKLNLPKFSFTYTLSLVKDLKEMGMSTAFSSQADFTGISKAVQLTITDVIHKAFVKVDEKGTEAAAATAVIFGETTSVLQPVLAKVMNINKPFVFMIKDNQTGTVLFAGKVVNPKCD